MFELKKLEIHHFFSNTETTFEIKEALKLQAATFLEIKYKKNPVEAAIAADNYIEAQSKKIKVALESKNADRVERILDKYNDTKYKNHFLFSDMINTLKNKEISYRFNKRIIQRLNNKNQARGLAFLCFENNLNSKQTYNNNKLCNSLLNYNPDNDLLSKNKIDYALKFDKAINQDLKNQDKDYLYKVVKNSKEFAFEMNSIFIKPVFDFIGELLNGIITPFDAFILSKIEDIKNVLKLVSHVLLAVVKDVFKVAKLTVDAIDNVNDLRLQNRRSEKYKNVKKLKYKMEGFN